MCKLCFDHYKGWELEFLMGIKSSFAQLENKNLIVLDPTTTYPNADWHFMTFISDDGYIYVPVVELGLMGVV